MPEDLAAIATACNHEGGRPVTREVVLREFLSRYSEHLDDLTAARVAYDARLLTTGRRVRIEQADGVLTGFARSVDEFGRLVLERDDGTTEVIAVGDVVHLRTED